METFLYCKLVLLEKVQCVANRKIDVYLGMFSARLTWESLVYCKPFVYLGMLDVL